MAMYTKKQSLEASDAIPTGQKKQAPYVPAYASATAAAEQQERLAIIERIPPNASAALPHLATTNYQVDRSVREAILATADYWQEQADMLIFTSSDKLKVHLGTLREPLETAEALRI